MHHGATLGFGAFSYAPSLEIGVVCLFGAMAAELGFVIESFSPRFPDCYAKRRIILPSGETRWQSCRIEFEYKSSNFALHKHDPAGADLIVCWEHDDPDPKVRVLELKSAIQVRSDSRVAPWSPSAAYHAPDPTRHATTPRVQRSSPNSPALREGPGGREWGMPPARPSPHTQLPNRRLHRWKLRPFHERSVPKD